VGTYALSTLFLATAVLGQAPPGDDYYGAATGAARELARAVELLQRSLVTMPGPDDGRGIYQQLEPIQMDVTYVRQQLQRRAGRDDLYLAFAKVDGELNQLLGDVQNFGKWAPAVALALRRVRTAQHDLHFALSAGDEGPARQAESAYRQTLALQTRLEDLQNLVRYVFTQTDALPGWDAGFAELRGALTGLQRLQKDRAGRDDVRPQFAQVDRAWEKLVAKYRDLPEGQHLLLRADFGQTDGALARLAGLLGVQGRRPPLKADYY